MRSRWMTRSRWRRAAVQRFPATTGSSATGIRRSRTPSCTRNELAHNATGRNRTRPRRPLPRGQGHPATAHLAGPLVLSADGTRPDPDRDVLVLPDDRLVVLLVLRLGRHIRGEVFRRMAEFPRAGARPLLLVGV